GDIRPTPRVAAASDEFDAVVGAGPGGPGVRVDGFAGLDVRGKAHQRHVPADPHGAGAVLGPLVGVDVRDVLQLELRFGVRCPAVGDLDPAGFSAGLPCSGESFGGVAGFDPA